MGTTKRRNFAPEYKAAAVKRLIEELFASNDSQSS